MNDLATRHCSPQRGPALFRPAVENLLNQPIVWTMDAGMAFGYNKVTVTFSTHSIGGLSENDVICAAKVDALGAA